MMRFGRSMPTLNARVHRIGTARSVPSRERRNPVRESPPRR